MANQDGHDLLSAALDDAGLDFGDFEDPQFNPSTYNPLQFMQNVAVPTNIKIPLESVLGSHKPASSVNNISYNHKITGLKLPHGSNLQTRPFAGTSLLQSNSNHLYAQQLNASHLGNPIPPQFAANQYQSLIKSGQPLQAPQLAPVIPIVSKDEDEVDEEEDIFQAETYADYKPAKLKIGQRHPDPVVETSSLSSIAPPDCYYRFAIPEETIDEGKLSALQLEAIGYACQQHDRDLKDGSRAGFLLGDGAGVGKGRTLAGLIYENYLLERKRAIWLSVSNDLRYDAERDLKDIGAKKILVLPLNKFRYGKISSKENGGFKKGVIFATYSSLIGESHSTQNKYNTRFKQLIHWCGEDFDGVIVFDECHKAKNLCPAGSSKPTKTGLTVLELQRKLPRARIVYASATGASEPKNMAYMVRLGLWGEGTPFPEFIDFVNTVEKRGVGAMELVAIDMKLRGVYIARQLSFQGVQFRADEISLTKKFTKLYDDCVELWVDAKNRFDKALELMEDDSHVKKTVWGQFWASHQRFFKYLCIAAKVKHAVELSREALKSDKCVVIGLQSTGEAKTLEQLEDAGGELNDFVSTAKAVFQSLIEKNFPAPNRKKTLKLLGREPSFLDELGITVNENGTTRLQPINSLKQSTSLGNKSDRAARKGKVSNVWTMSDDSSEAESEKASDFEPSDEDDSEDYESVSEGEDSDGSSESDIDQMWDAFEAKEKGKKRRKARSKGAKGKGRTKRPKMKERKEDFRNIKAEFMSPEAGDICERMRDELLARIDDLGPKLPPNTLDELIEELGGPENVAEMTGRKGRVISGDNGVQYESRTENDVALEILNVTEKQRFMDGEKEIAIISEAASSGISLHSDRRAKNTKRRVHLTIELPWSADRAIQQFGRSHRSNQRSAPEYVFLISDLAGEQRFASIVAKRLESLGALTHGDRRATESRDLSKYNIDNKYGREALETVMKSVIGQVEPRVNPPEGFDDFFLSCRLGLLGVGLVSRGDGFYSLEKDYNVMSKFLNRILGMEVKLQNALFKYFSDTLEVVIKDAKRLGRYDLGIMDLTSDAGRVERRKHQTFYTKHSTGSATIELHEVAVERGMSWDESQTLWSHCKSIEEGYYLTNAQKSRSVGVFLVVADTTNTKNFSKQVFRVYKPNTGLQSKTETLHSIRDKGKKVTPEECEKDWKRIYEESAEKCSHEVWLGRCSRKRNNLQCDVGLRKRIYHIVSGSILSFWEMIEKTNSSQAHSKLQIVRLKIEEADKKEVRVIGTLVPEKGLKQLVEQLTILTNAVKPNVVKTE